MAEYISKGNAIFSVSALPLTLDAETTQRAIEAVRAVPAADVVEVVRCNDCAIPHNRWTGCPRMNGTIMRPDDYCSYGKHKEG